ncbi:hypothetical protein T4C_5415 [Trichinella pseudospiralis]|uniref:Uncharacterized protein n=1 Tax=Trichinella pseudospiralis TaxID=6337 RepID=A0A0V1JLL7_TRIPS|nr:hypothetical protein T4D_1384 [Trichinella pseudospiralis]KRZ35477.1 hypothetical protein T4C_5415 [Trichinella pseudospiralis]
MRLKWAVEFADFKPAGLVDKLPDNCKPATVVNPLSIDLTDSRYAGLGASGSSSIEFSHHCVALQAKDAVVFVARWRH